MDKYIVVKSEEFAKRIEEQEELDVIISSHNLEHCNEPQRVLAAMAKALKKNGMMYLSFPSEASANFPERYGTLNFYQYPGHIYLPIFKDVIEILEQNGMKIIYKQKNYQPYWLKKIGEKNEATSIAVNRVLRGTWAYWGFETVIWAKKR